MFTRLGRGVTQHPVIVIIIWLGLIAAALAGSAALGSVSSSAQDAKDLPSHYESAQAESILEKAFPTKDPPGSATLVFTRTDGHPLTEANRQAVNVELPRLQAKAAKGVSIAQDASLSPNRAVQIAAVSFDEDNDSEAATDAVGHIRKQAKTDLTDTGLQARMTGEAAKSKDSGLQGMLTTFGMIAGIVLLLLLMFRSVVIALTTVIIIFAVGEGVDALLNVAAHAFGFTLGGVATELLPIVLFGVGTDYVVFLMFRYRERLRAGDDHRAALAAGVGRVGEAVVASALAVAASFSMLLVSQLGSFRVLGPTLGFAVIVMLFTVLTLVPAVLTLLGKRLARRKSWRREPTARVTGRLGDLAARRPALVSAMCIGVLLVGALAIFGYKSSYENDPYPAGSQSAAGNVDLQRGFPAGTMLPAEVVVAADHGRVDPAALDSLRSTLRDVPGVGEVARGKQTPSGDVAVLDVILDEDPTSAEALDVVAQMERRVHANTPDGVTVKVGGQSAAYNDMRHVIGHDMGLILPLAGLAIGLILLLMLRAALAPLVLIASVGLGYAATLGASVLLFQAGTGNDGLFFMMPLVAFLFVASIGTDYNILMVSRLREELRRGATPRQAVRTAVRHAGPAVAAAGSVLAVSFGTLLIGGGHMAQIGFSVAIGALISTFVMAFLLTPALLTVLGPKVWWPSRPAQRVVEPGPSPVPVDATMSRWQP